MTTVRGKLEEMLIERGMFDTQAEAVMDLAIPKMDDVVENYNFTWDTDSNEYPQVIYNVLFSTVKETALEWINTNKPQAWYKPMFEAVK
ncbi:MAG: hypothetical protein ACI9J3_003307 [Parvicellaceae bacterium]|jgi:hypothetical protein